MSENDIQGLPNGYELDQYIITKLVGSGGMGIVYLAKDKLLGRDICIKVLHSKFNNDPIRKERMNQRFMVETRAIAQLNHHNIVTMHWASVSKHKQIPYIVMEYIDGVDLGAILKAEKRLEWKQVILISQQILCALEHTHRRGVIHRDIKPENIMIRAEDDIVKVTDFGLARIKGLDAQITDQNTIIGTMSYMSPEQWSGREITPKTDIYSIGVLMYELLSGVTPYTGSYQETFRKAVIGQHVCVSDIVPDVPHELVLLIHSMLEVDADDRPSATESLAILKSLIAKVDKRELELNLEKSILQKHNDGKRMYTLPIPNQSTELMDPMDSPTHSEISFFSIVEIIFDKKNRFLFSSLGTIIVGLILAIIYLVVN